MAYEAERGIPSTDQCVIGDGSVRLLFDGYYLKLLIDSEVDCAWHARSGLPSDDEFNYSVDQQKRKSTGPIPEGAYWISPSQIRSVSYGNDSWGSFRITIHYYPKTETYGRGGFFVHGGKTFGSKGCIDLAQYMPSFIKKMNEQFFGVEVPNTEGGGLISGYSDCYIPLDVKYGRATVGMP